jgi:hypothetical protein
MIRFLKVVDHIKNVYDYSWLMGKRISAARV